MLATQERMRIKDGLTVLVWHKVAQPEDCDGECDFHPIACSADEGIILPGPMRDVPLTLDEPGQRWCGDCLAANAVRKAS